ncbi:type III secretion system translocon subunit AopB [Aeromonas veronii]|uniref:type III secretion system translocon subunit AopB n=1 Tax=Aeromonas veronii TaxID=654 RepID=UPI0014313677|nr:type III secretion system translocon subunit AopB [Aeromonas veronii]NJI22435.1 type III secretion system translocon subunit AopB [Aeromonas veronii]NJI33671.1 type III secretion system translocon subunit AopB [Aeromonas veronii]
MNPISNERQVSPLGNTGDVAGLAPVTQPRSETRLDAATVQVTGQARKSGVSLNPPLAVSNSQVSAQQLGEIGKLVASVKENTRLILPHTAGLVTAAFTSPEAFEIELGKLTSDLEKTQTKLKLDDIRRARELNEKKIGENQEKIKEAEESAQEAKKAGIFGKIFGWLSAIASIVIGAIMVATGVGAAAGALMIAAGVVGVVNMAVQHLADAGYISPEVMEHLGKALMGIEMALAIISLGASFGSSIGSVIGKVATKISSTAADAAAKLISKVGELTAKFTAKATVEALKVTGQAAKVLKVGTQAADVLVDVGSGVTKSVQSTKESESLDAQADLALSKSEMTELQGVIDKLKEAIAQMLEAFQQTMEMIFQMINAKGDMMNNLARRPAAI